MTLDAHIKTGSRKSLVTRKSHWGFFTPQSGMCEEALSQKPGRGDRLVLIRSLSVACIAFYF